VTLALMVVVAPTCDPAVGEVTVTIKLPSCADTLDAKNDVHPMSMSTMPAPTVLLVTLACLEGRRDSTERESI
jgi:hypothetical protein